MHSKTSVKVMITGASGQLGWELVRSAPLGVEVYALTAQELNITDKPRVKTLIESLRPNFIINCAAYTAVDKAEQERSLAYSVNGLGAEYLATSAREVNAKFFQLSTDFVFDGTQSHSYSASDLPRPLSVYGASKLEGEQRVLAVCDQSVIIRTAWVYSVHGHNFVKTMLRLMREREEIRVVADQIGTPTWGRNLAHAIWVGVNSNMAGIYHYTDAGVASWYDFAVAIFDESRSLGLLTRDVAVLPISTAEYPTPAKRPTFSILEKSKMWSIPGVKKEHWRTSLRHMLGEIQNFERR